MRQAVQKVRIGGASGFWGDAALSTPQLLNDVSVDFLVYDYLAEITMAILARAKAKSPELGYATDFLTAAMAPNLKQIAAQGVRVISNAGGINPEGCAAALREEIKKQGLDLRVAVVTGDDVSDRIERIAKSKPTDMFNGTPFPPLEKITSANAYVGAFPVAAALDTGAAIVITGRCVDSALTLGVCIHTFGWGPNDLDELAGGALAGHLLECGPQATGGNFTDWDDLAENLANIGYPIADVVADGSFDMRKPERSRGIVSLGTVGEQMLYEIGDPQAYVLPDVTCDFSCVVIEESARDKVHVSGAKGRAAPDTYKVCLTWHDGFRGGQLFSFYGIDAERKAESFAQNAFERGRAALRSRNEPDFSHTSVELIGAESQFGRMRKSGPSRELVAKLAVRHPQAEGVGLFLKEATGLGLSAPPGLSGFAGARPKPSPVLALFSFLMPRDQVHIKVDGATFSAPVGQRSGAQGCNRPDLPPRPNAHVKTLEVPIVQLAWGRSGDKGDIANVGLIARRAEFLPWLWHGVDEILLRQVFGHFASGRIERYFLPGSHAMNILLHDALGGGGTRSLRNDPQGKGYAQLLLSAPIRVDASLMKDG